MGGKIYEYPDMSACEGCTYLGQMEGYIKFCDYLDGTGQRRPCPAGKGCTVKKIGARKKKPVIPGDY